MEEVKTIDSKCCKELYVILNKLNLFYKLPNELKKYISENQDLLYKYDINVNLPLIYQIENEKTKECISYLYLKYINDNIEEKNTLLKKYVQNEEKYQNEIKIKYNLENIFKKNNIKQNSVNTIPTKEVAITNYKESILKKLLNKIKFIFCRK